MEGGKGKEGSSNNPLSSLSLSLSLPPSFPLVCQRSEVAPEVVLWFDGARVVVGDGDCLAMRHVGETTSTALATVALLKKKEEEEFWVLNQA